MSLTELFPDMKMLERADKLRLMQFLVVDLAQEEGIPLLSADTEYPIARLRCRRYALADIANASGRSMTTPCVLLIAVGCKLGRQQSAT
jgi:hypothetical protein